MDTRIHWALDGVLSRLAEAHMIVGHGQWIDGRIVGRRLQVTPRPGAPAHLLIATLAPADDHPEHAGPCPPSAPGDVLRLFDPTCGGLCPERCGGDAAYIAQRLTRAIAAALGESPERIARIIRNAPPQIPTPSTQPLSLVDALF